MNPKGRDPLFFEIKNAPRKEISQNSQRESKAFYHYLLGELSENDQEYTQAIDHYTKSSDLFVEATPEVNRKLAKLYLREGNLEKALEQSQRVLSADPQDEDSMLLYAGILEASDRGKEAEDVYKKLTVLRPGSLEASVFLTNLYLEDEEYSKASDIINNFVHENPNRFEGWFHKGRIAILNDDLPAAEKSFLQAFHLDSSKDAVVKSLLRIYLTQKDYDKAEDFAKIAARENPGSPLPRQVLSQILLGAGKYDEALEHLQFLETFQKDSDTRLKIALIQIDKKEFEEAERLLNLILAKDSNHNQAKYYLAVCQAGTGQEDKAIETLNTVDPSNEEYIRSMTFSFFLYSEKNDSHGAEESIKKAYLADKSNLKTLSYLVSVYRENDKSGEALPYLDEAITSNPDNEGLLYTKSVILGDQNLRVESIATMEKVLEINPKNADAMNFIAYALTEERTDFDRAFLLIKKALEIRPKDPFYLDTLAWIYFQKEEYVKAEQILSEALQAGGDDPEILEHYGDVQKSLGDNAEALKAYEAAIELSRVDKSSNSKKRIEKLQRKLGDLNRSS